MSGIFNKKKKEWFLIHMGKKRKEKRACSLFCTLSCEGTARQTSASQDDSSYQELHQLAP